MGELGQEAEDDSFGWNFEPAEAGLLGAVGTLRYAGKGTFAILL